MPQASHFMDRKYSGGGWTDPQWDPDSPFEVPWHKQAACYRQGYALYFHEGKFEAKQKAKQAKKYCNEPCPVKDLCLISSLENRDKHGVWGGLTPNERKKLLARIDAGELTKQEAVQEVCGV